MYANLIAVIDLSPRLVVPHEAVIFAGPRKLVFIDEGGGLMRPVEVELGVRDDEGFEVKKGLAVGMRVVTSGNFLIGAESRLRSALGAW
jgi:Cu(I)/Ag(I) efflux system membrane fusion protein